jgi:uncharacterized HAD superfamily protein
MKNKIKETAEVLAKVAEIPKPALGLDLDGTITDNPEFFKLLASVWGGPVYVITYRADYDSCVMDLEHFGIEVDRIILVNEFSEKAKWIKKLNITVFFDDMDEVTTHIPEGVTVFKPRNDGNFCFDTKRWLYSEHTGRKV